MSLQANVSNHPKPMEADDEYDEWGLDEDEWGLGSV